MYRLTKLSWCGIIILGMISLALAYYFNLFGPHLSLSKTSFKHLHNWQQDNQSQALLAFQQSCEEINRRNPQLKFSGLPNSGRVQDWQVICHYAKKLDRPTELVAREFFETWFQPYAIKNNLRRKGLFTGYYLSAINASFKKTKQYNVPIYGLPDDLVKLDLDTYHIKSNRTILTGKITNNWLTPYPDRRAINHGAINRHAQIILWSDNAIDIFFAQIQGSALVTLPDHKKLLIGYAGDNGRRYTAIGKILIQQYGVDKKTISMQTIRTWLEQHPKQAESVLNQNESYVFFEPAVNLSPVGSEKVPLTPERSLAVDTHYLALGAPIWLSTKIPQLHANKAAPYQHLLVAQDTGGAIRGAVRGDIYWGEGDRSASLAGEMNHAGEYWVLLPRYLS